MTVANPGPVPPGPVGKGAELRRKSRLRGSQMMDWYYQLEAFAKTAIKAYGPALKDIRVKCDACSSDLCNSASGLHLDSTRVSLRGLVVVDQTNDRWYAIFVA